jgi:hypothetical protein
MTPCILVEVQCVRKVALLLRKVFEVMFKSVYTGLNRSLSAHRLSERTVHRHFKKPSISTTLHDTTCQMTVILIFTIPGALNSIKNNVLLPFTYLSQTYRSNTFHFTDSASFPHRMFFRNMMLHFSSYRVQGMESIRFIGLICYLAVSLLKVHSTNR